MKSEQVGMRENKSGEFFPQYFASGFGENFPWRKFPAIRYITLAGSVSSIFDSTLGMKFCVCVCVVRGREAYPQTPLVIYASLKLARITLEL